MCSIMMVMVIDILFEEKVCQVLSCKVIRADNKHIYSQLVLLVKKTNVSFYR